MPERDQQGEILRRLAERLPGDLLRELFPDHEAQAIRDALRRAAGNDTPSRKPGPPEPKIAAPAPKPAAREGGACILYADGASRGNPGEAGAGVLLLDAQRRELASRAIYLGSCTNNVAEYRALVAGLELALEHGCERLSIFLDSELIVRQINGQYKVRNEHLQPLYLKARGLLQRLGHWSIRHVPRAENARADELANRGIDERSK